MRLYCHTTILLALCCTLFDAVAQPRFEYRTTWIDFGGAVNFMHWEITQPGQVQQFDQSYIPFTLTLPVQRQTTLSLTGFGSKTAADPVFVQELNGISDIRLRLAHRFGADQWMFAVGFNLPSGRSKLTASENTLVDILTEPVFGFQSQRLGAGPDVELSLNHAINLNESLGLGLGGVLILPGEFEFQSGSEAKYRPGNLYVLTAVVNEISFPVKWNLGLVGKIFDRDRLNQNDFFKQGAQLEVTGTLAWRFARQWEINADARHVVKGDNQVLSSATGATLPLHFYIDNSSRTGVALVHDFGRHTRLSVNTSWTHLGESNQQIDRATVWRFGGAATQKISENWMLGVSGEFATGNAEDGVLDLRGYGVGLWLQVHK